MQIADNCVVAIHYKLTDDDGQVIDSSEGQAPLAYLHGHQGIIPGLEKELTGKAAGDQMTVVVPPEEGYGDVNPDLIQQVPHEAFQGVEQIQPGMQFEVRGENGAGQVVVVREVSDAGVTIDGNHPLAGQQLNFDVTVDSVRAGTEEELQHGHVHS